MLTHLKGPAYLFDYLPLPEQVLRFTQLQNEPFRSLNPTTRQDNRLITVALNGAANNSDRGA